MRRSHASLALALLLVLPALAHAAEPAPRLVVAEPSKDLGVLATGAKVTHAFEIRNAGDAPLELTEVLASCGCTVAEFDRVIAPGATGKVVAAVDAISLNGKGSTQLTVTSNDPEQATTTLKLDYEVRPSILAKPGYARWSYVQLEPEGTIGQVLWSNDGASFRVLGVDAPGTVKASFREAETAERNADATGSQWKVELTVPSDAPVGAITGMAIVHTDHPRQQRVPIPVSGFVRPRYFLHPASGDFGQLSLSEPKSSIYQLQSFATASVEVEKIETTVPGITATAEALEPGRKFEVELRFDPAAMKPGPFEGKLVVRLSDPLQPVVELPLRGELVRPPKTASAEGR